MAFSAKAVANDLLGRAEADGQELDPMQIQKLVYFAHGWHLALQDKPLIRETIEAWPYGPVVRALFHEFKRWGSGAIRERAKVDSGGIFARHEPASMDREITHDHEYESAQAILGRVWQVYGKFTGVQLSNLTHQPDTPWTEARKASPGARDIPISNELLKQYFKSRVERNVHVAAGF